MNKKKEYILFIFEGTKTEPMIFENLKKIGDNNYTIKNKNDIDLVEFHDGNLVIGSIEASNVNTMVSMVSLIEAQRKFEQSQKALTGIDEINKKVIDSIGNGR